MSIFKLPDLGEGLPDAEINQWHVTEGDIVKADQLMVSMETAKAVVDVPAPQAGKIKKLYGAVGDIIQTGAPLVEFEADENKPADAGTVVGKTEVGNTVIAAETAAPLTQSSNTTQIKALPAIRNLAKELGVDLAAVTATGPNGQITADDVRKAIGANAGKSESAININIEGGIVEPLRGVRRAMAQAMSQSHAEVVPVTLVDDADINTWPKGTDITARVLRAIARACAVEPALNAYFNSKNSERILFKDVHIGIAMDSKDGLFVPVIKNVQALSATEIRQQIDTFKTAVANRTVPADDLKGSTIQLSNFGTFAGRYANPILVPPNVAILGTGKIRFEPVAVEQQVAIHRMLPLSLTIDHRAITGGEAARFLAAVIEDLGKAD